MMRTMDSADIISKLRANGWVLAHTKGSHHQYKHPEKSGRVTVPHPRKDIPVATLRSIFRQAGLDWKERK